MSSRLWNLVSGFIPLQTGRDILFLHPRTRTFPCVDPANKKLVKNLCRTYCIAKQNLQAFRLRKFAPHAFPLFCLAVAVWSQILYIFHNNLQFKAAEAFRLYCTVVTTFRRPNLLYCIEWKWNQTVHCVPELHGRSPFFALPPRQWARLK